MNARETDIRYFKGKTISELSDIVFFKKVDVSGYAVIYIHVGTNDLNNLIASGEISHTLPVHIMERFRALRANIRRVNSTAIIQFSSIMPRMEDFTRYDPLIRGINFALEKWCAKTQGACIFVPSWRWFVHGGSPIQAYYCRDGIHPNGAGNSALQAGIQQSMSIATMVERATSRRVKRLAELPF